MESRESNSLGAIIAIHGPFWHESLILYSACVGLDVHKSIATGGTLNCKLNVPKLSLVGPPLCILDEVNFGVVSGQGFDCKSDLVCKFLKCPELHSRENTSNCVHYLQYFWSYLRRLKWFALITVLSSVSRIMQPPGESSSSWLKLGECMQLLRSTQLDLLFGVSIRIHLGSQNINSSYIHLFR